VTTSESALQRPRGGLRRRILAAGPYLLLAPGMLWLLAFFIWPMLQMFLMSISSGSLDDGFKLSGSTAAYVSAFTKFGKQFGNSLFYGGAATVLDFLIGFPVAYTVAFRGGRYKNLLLFLVIAPFFTSFLIRTISWKTLLDGPLLGFPSGHPAYPAGRCERHGNADRGDRRPHLQLPAVHDPAALRRSREDRPATDRGGQ